MEKMRVSAVIPAYNEAKRIQQTIQEIRPFVDEIIVIDDGSQDNTLEIACQAGAITYKQPQRAGYIAAIKQGFRLARGDIIITMDGDGEFPAEKIPDLVRPILAGRADMVQGKRQCAPRSSEKLLNKLANIKAPVGDSGTGMRAIKSSLARKLHLHGACICGIFTLEVVSLGGRLAETPVDLRSVDKPRRIAWYHVQQLFYVIFWLLKPAWIKSSVRGE